MSRSARLFRRFAAVTLIALSAMAAPVECMSAGRGPVWEAVGYFPPSPTSVPRSDVGQTTLEVKVSDGWVYITTETAVKVEVFPILGQLVTSRDLEPGTVRLQLGNRGIYIFKAAGVTRRVNL